MFPSLSGKTSIRTRIQENTESRSPSTVSIPFREDLHSDFNCVATIFPKSPKVSIPFREDLHSDRIVKTTVFRYKKKVSIPFREDLHSDSCSQSDHSQSTSFSFHPFQGRPPFGRYNLYTPVYKAKYVFPSLSGKTSIRTVW